MKKITCVLFDMDGVMIDTEPQYDKFWKQAGEEYNAGIENFEKVIKGTTLPNILSKYFSHLSKEEHNELSGKLDEFELNMDFEEIPGSIAFANALKKQGIKIGLVTSSTDSKLVAVNRRQGFDRLFDTIVSAAHVVQGKPNPECYLIAAQRLSVAPEDCIVFEDSFAGIEAGKSAGMTVIGLHTTHRQEAIEEKGIWSIRDFEGFTIDELQGILCRA